MGDSPAMVPRRAIVVAVLVVLTFHGCLGVRRNEDEDEDEFRQPDPEPPVPQQQEQQPPKPSTEAPAAEARQQTKSDGGRSNDAASYDPDEFTTKASTSDPARKVREPHTSGKP